MSERIVDVNISKQSQLDLQSYAVYVARSRQIPYFIDGLKPVVRKILWCSAYDYGGQGFIKTAKVVGNVIAKYNPHGDSGVNSAIRNLINDFSTKYPLMEGSGSWGSKVDPYAAQPRYNECKISKFAVDVFIRDINEDKRATDWVPNYDNKCMEPAYLPARIPALLVLGQVGIAVGVKSSIPAHNLGEVIDATISLMRNPDSNICLIPDECMRCEIINTDWQTINNTGTGTYIVQGIIDVGEYQYGKSIYPCLIVRSLPDFTFFDSVEENIKKLVKSGKMPYIIDMISKSGVDKKGKYNFEEIIILKKGTDPNFVKEFLYTNTGIRQTRQINLIVIKENNLAMMNYKEYLIEFIKFRRVSIYRRLNVKLQSLKTKLHETELYIKLLTNKGALEKVIAMIRKNRSRDKQEIVDFLVKELKVTPIQAKFLSCITLPQLSAGYLKKCQEDREKYEKEANMVTNQLLDEREIDNIVINEMLEIKEKYNDKRKCRIITRSEAMGIAPGIFKLVFMKNGFVKKMAENDVIPVSKLPNVNFTAFADNSENIIVFTSLGKTFKIAVSKIQFTDQNSDGIDIRVLNKYCSTDICCAASEGVLKELSNNKLKNYIFIVSRNGYIKKIDIDDIITTPNSGLIYSRIDENDYIQGILFGPDEMDILVYSKNKVLRLSPKEIPYLKRSTKGNRVSTNNTLIDGMNFVIPNSTCVVIITKEGYVNKIDISTIQLSSRGKAGIKVMNMKKTDGIANIWPCTENNKLIVREGKSTKEIMVSDIPFGSTISNGVKMFNDVSKVALGI